MITLEVLLHPIAALRARLGLTQEEFGARIGLRTKGSVSLVERGLSTMSPEVALAIEEISGGEIDASELNPIVAKARGVPSGQVAQAGHEPLDTGKLAETSTGQNKSLPGHIVARASFGAADIGERGTRVALPDGGRA